MRKIFFIFLLMSCWGHAMGGQLETHVSKEILDADKNFSQKKWSEPVGSEFFLSQQFSGWNLWTRFAAEESAKNIFRGLDFEISRDVGRQRLVMGDLVTGEGGYLFSTRLSGVSFRQELSLGEAMAPDKINKVATQGQPLAFLLSPHEIYFKQDVWVQIWDQEILLGERFFTSGQYDLREIPLLLGLQRAKLQISNRYGVEQTLSIQMMDHGVLPKGQQIFRYDLGSPWTEREGIRSYRSSGSYFSMRHQYGVSESMTVGMQYQSWLYRQFGAIEVSYNSPWGLFGLVAGASNIVDVLGGVGKGFWRSHAQHEDDWMWSIDVDQRADGFFEIRPDNLAPAKFETRLDAGAKKRIGDGLVLGLGGYHENNFFAEPDASVARMQIDYAISSRWRMTVFFDEQINGARVDRSGLTVAWNDFPARNSASTTNGFSGRSSESYFAHVADEKSEGLAGHVFSKRIPSTSGMENQSGGVLRYRQNRSHFQVERRDKSTRVGAGGVLKWGDDEFNGIGTGAQEPTAGEASAVINQVGEGEAKQPEIKPSEEKFPEETSPDTEH